MSNNQGHKILIVYQKAFAAAMEIYQHTKSFPKEETYSLTDQIRRSSRSVCANIAEAYRKRLYPKHFISKLSDSDGECAETMVHLDFARDCGYLNEEKHQINRRIFTNRENVRQHDEFTGKIFGNKTANCSC